MQPTVIYLHGFASSAKNRKAIKITEKLNDNPLFNFVSFEFTPEPVDFSNMTVTGMVNRLRQFILTEKIRQPVLVGSSLGGLVALHYTSIFGDIKHCLLLAPALRFRTKRTGRQAVLTADGSLPVFHYGFNKEIPLYKSFMDDVRLYKDYIKPPVNCTIIHGKKDTVVPVRTSRYYANKYAYRVKLIEVDSDHNLTDQVDLIWDWIIKLVS